MATLFGSAKLHVGHGSFWFLKWKQFNRFFVYHHYHEHYITVMALGLSRIFWPGRWSVLSNGAVGLESVELVATD